MSTETDELETIYRPDMTWMEFFHIFPKITPTETTKIKMISILEKNGFSRPEAIMDLPLKEIEYIDGISTMKARQQDYFFAYS